MLQAELIPSPAKVWIVVVLRFKAVKLRRVETVITGRRDEL
jgi:hypothetical protein